MFTWPVFLVGATLATVWAALFHLILGKRILDLVLFWCVALLGFGIGQAVAQVLGLHWLLVGEVQVAAGTLACWTAMLIARWLKV